MTARTTRFAATPEAVRALAGWVVVLAVVAAFAGLGGRADAGQSRAVTTQATSGEQESGGDVARGGELYATYCAECHGADGRGGQVPGTDVEVPAIAGPDGVTLPYVDLVMRTGRMPPAGDPFDNQARDVIFDDAQRRAIVAYAAIELGVEGEIPTVPEGDAARGQQVYAANCAACHGATGQGGVAGGGAFTPAITGYAPVAIAEAIRVGPFQMPAFERGQISDQEVADIATFLDEVSEEQGTVLGLVELNPVFASGFAALLALAAVFSVLWISGSPTWFPTPTPKPGSDSRTPADAERRRGWNVRDGAERHGASQTSDEAERAEPE